MPDAEDVLDLSIVSNPVAPDVRPILRELALVDDRVRAEGVLADSMGVDPERLVLTDGSPASSEAVAVAVAGGDAVADDTWLVLSEGRWTSAAASSATRWHTGSLQQLWGLEEVGLAWVLAPSAAAATKLRERTERPSLVALSLVEPLVGLTDPGRWSAIVASLRADLVTLLEAYGCEVQAAFGPFVVVLDAGPLVDELAARGVLVARIPQPDGRTGARITVPEGTALLRLATALHAASTSLAASPERSEP